MLRPLRLFQASGELDASASIRNLSLVDYTAPWLKILVTCSKGTYVRVLGEDIGAALGCGAHLNALRRIQVGALTAETMTHQ